MYEHPRPPKRLEMNGAPLNSGYGRDPPAIQATARASAVLVELWCELGNLASDRL